MSSPEAAPVSGPSPEAVARSLADAHPQSMLPCPVCAASVRGLHLSQHFVTVHGSASADGWRWAGADHGIVVPIYLCFVLVLAQVFLVARLAPQELVRPLMAVVAVQQLAALAGLAAAELGRLPATLGIHGDRLVLRYGFGLLRRSVTLPVARVETGQLRRGISTPYGRGYRVIGVYLRLVDATGGSLTLGSSGTTLRTHWDPAGWSSAGARRHWHVMVDAAALVAVEYWLARHGHLTPRAG